MIYTVAINSVDINSSDKMFNFDWSVLPADVPYTVTFSFLSDEINLQTFPEVAMLYVDLGQAHSYIVTKSVISQTTQFVSNLIPQSCEGISYLTTTPYETPILYLNNRPSNNNFLIKILNQVNTDWQDSNNKYPDFVLTMSFKKMD